MARPKKDGQESGAAELFRRLKSNPPLFIGTVLVLVLVIVSFILVPALPNTGMGTGEENLVFGSYNDIPIAYTPGNYFDRIFRNISEMEGFRPESDYSVDTEMGDKAMRVWQRAFYMTLSHVAILDEMKNTGYAAPQAEIDREVAGLQIFQENGRFSVTKFRNYNKNDLFALRRATEEDYIERQYRNAFSGLRVSAGEKDFIGAMSSPERSFLMVSFARSSYPDSEIIAYAKSNPDHFRMMHLSKITAASSEKDARQILDAVQSGKTGFEDAARNQSVDSSKDQGGDLGIRMAYELYTSIADESQRAGVLGLKPGEISGIVKDPAGWAFYRSEAASYDADFSLPENMEKARSYMSLHAGGVMENWLVARAEEFIARASDLGFEAAAEEAELELKRFGPISLNYGNVSLFNPLAGDAELQQAVFNENFWRIAFTTPVNVPSAPFTVGSNVIVLAAAEENVKDETEKSYIANMYANGYWMYTASDSALSAAISGSKKAKDNFLMAYVTRILSPNSNAQ
jgi:hypothetical protein